MGEEGDTVSRFSWESRCSEQPTGGIHITQQYCNIYSALQRALKSGSTSELYDNDKSYVSWRGDGQYFTCSTIDSDTGRKILT